MDVAVAEPHLLRKNQKDVSIANTDDGNNMGGMDHGSDAISHAKVCGRTHAHTATGVRNFLGGVVVGQLCSWIFRLLPFDVSLKSPGKHRTLKATSGTRPV